MTDPITSRPKSATCAAMLATCLWAVSCAAAPAKPAGTPDNLALKATASASSEYSDRYKARFACDGKIPAAGSKADLDKAWVARGNSHPGGVLFTLSWPEPVTVAQIVYYGRTGWVWAENWKDYEVYADAPARGKGKPVTKGTLKPGHGPQRIELPKPQTLERLTLKFLNSYGGPNPGASEIRVYSVSPPEKLLGKFIAPDPSLMRGGGPLAPPPPPIEPSPELAARLEAGGMGFDKIVVVQRHHIRCSHVYTYHCEGQRDGGGLFVHDVKDGRLTRLVDAAGGQIQACDLSHDGRTVVFGWRKGKLPYQVWSINVDGTGLRQLTRGGRHNYDPAWLPDGRIVFLSTRRPQAAYCFFTPVGILYTMGADGTDPQRISSNYLNDFTPAVTNDGRIIYGRWEYVDRPAIPIQSLWTINPDGTMLQGFYGNRVLDPATFIEPQAIPGSGAILCTLTGHNGSCRGAIGIVDPIHGDNAAASMRNITPEVRLRGVHVSSNGPRGPYQTPYPVDGKYFLVSHDGTLLLRDYDRTEQTIVLAPREGMGFYNPRPVRARPGPPVRSNPLPPAARDEPWATVCLQNVYNGLEPHVKPGEIKQILVVQERPRTLISSAGIHRPAFGYQRVLISCGATYVPKKVWGTAEVAEDGSAYFRVPARQPIYFIALDADGRAVQRMRSFTHLMGGEVQGCIGCHESRSERPRHASLPASLAGGAQELTPPEWGVRGFDYASIVQPVLDKHCLECHDAREAPQRIDLSGDRTDLFNVSYESLADVNQGRTGSPYVNWIPTYNGHEWNIRQITPRKWGSPVSKLADVIFSGHPDKDGKPRARLTDAERRRILTWIDLNVPYYGTADTAHPAQPACRWLFPSGLTKVMDDVYARRCQSCHAAKGVKPNLTWRRTYRWIGKPGLRIENPHLNDFLLAPLARSAGGTQRCGEPVFAVTDDRDYRAVLETFKPVAELIKQTPRMDMPNARPAPCCAADQQP